MALTAKPDVTIQPHCLQYTEAGKPQMLLELSFVTASLIAVLSIVISTSVLCLSVHSHITETKHPNVTKFSVHVTCVCDSDVRNALGYIVPVLWMTSCFHITQQVGRMRDDTFQQVHQVTALVGHQTTLRLCLVEFAKWRTGVKSAISDCRLLLC